MRLVLDDFSCWIGEYPSICRAAEREGWLRSLFAAHLTPCDQDDAKRLLNSVFVDGKLRPLYVPLRWTNRRGRASFTRKSRMYRISLPMTPGTEFAHLRAGLVLHEAAHVIDRMETGAFGHRESFRRILRRLVENEWRTHVRTGSQRDIYARHRGPYSLMIGRAVPGKGGKIVERTDRVAGPFSAEEAHEEARMLVNDPRDNVTDVHVFSNGEGQFTGAFYKRGNEYASWADMREAALEGIEEERRANEGGLELRPEQSAKPADEAALLQPGRRSDGDEPVREVEDLRDASPAPEALPKRRPVRNVPAETQAAAGASRKRGTLLGIAADKIDKWPASKGASIVREALIELGETGISAAELAKRLAANLAAAGVEFPASLISRLKQGGFIREVDH